MAAVQVTGEKGQPEASPAAEYLKGHDVDEAHPHNGHPVDGHAHDGHAHDDHKEGNWIVSFLDDAKDADYDGFIAWLERESIPIPDRANESYIKYVVVTPTPEQGKQQRALLHVHSLPLPG